MAPARRPQRTSQRKPNKSKSSVRESTKRQASAQPDDSRVETDVLLAIQPIHLSNIVHRHKNHEYRKYRLRDGVERLWLYETQGSREDKGRSAITHIATIPSIVRHTPGTVPEDPFGIGNAEFNAGQKQSKYGYSILELYELIRPITLEEMKQTWRMGAPMGWCYLKEGMWNDRWGDEEGRSDRVKRIF
ncbi:uncharacterized protein TRIVIDRAFT_67913 [Trichoderma virens Gv29-8]|uniref:Uncharacterized protein n=1 Tax=Hypocrea virens (strain Gv29-8 / FGSC 10586) TaxID=413071 RepID=G9N162_HYPVG|nr:uncharacterized protein TRIVIDRAFT_67913 [Trichoderma virens Gv29-8]EHK19495.1 hypothetical protein TRIVIDRAFT_67913 [Trichoderma virens Gv29-8]